MTLPEVLRALPKSPGARYSAHVRRPDKGMVDFSLWVEGGALKFAWYARYLDKGNVRDLGTFGPGSHTTVMHHSSTGPMMAVYDKKGQGIVAPYHDWSKAP